MHSLSRLKTLASCVLLCLALLPQAQAAPNVVPPPDGCYPNFTTAEGCLALQSLTAGAANTALGWRALVNDTTGGFNTAVGAGALILNNGDSNTATGAVALLLNTTGRRNTANGTSAMLNNSTGNSNCAFGASALNANTDGFSNNAFGDSALFRNEIGAENTAVGDLALENNDATGSGDANFNTALGALALNGNVSGDSNNAVGSSALAANTDGLFNQAIGVQALFKSVHGASNVAIGDSALLNYTGASGSGFNTVVGDQAGGNLSDGSDNIYIGATAAAGVTNEDGHIRIGDPQFVTDCFIAGISTAPVTGTAVVVNANGKLGVAPSSKRFKNEIKPMEKQSESILALKPVTFRYKQEIDANRIPQFGLVAEDVAKVNPDLVVRDREGKPYTVRYDAVNAMLLNEFIKEHQTVKELKAISEKQAARIALQENQIQTLTAALKQQAEQIEKVSAQLEMIRPTPRVVENR
jgi:trimeric autotransporter adhesin